MKMLFRAAVAVLGLGLAAGSCLPVLAQSDDVNTQHMTAHQQVAVAPHTGPAMERMDAPETNAQEEAYRHSASVQWIAKHLGVSTEAAAEIFEDINSGILIFFIVYFLVKKLPGVFRKRSKELASELTEAHNATADANRRLEAIEARLAHLDTEIEAFRAQSEREAVADEQRMHRAIEEERQRIVASAEQEIDAASAAAQRELKRFAADLAVQQARSSLRLTADMDRALIAEFGQSLGHERNGGGH